MRDKPNWDILNDEDKTPKLSKSPTGSRRGSFSHGNAHASVPSSDIVMAALLRAERTYDTQAQEKKFLLDIWTK